MLDTLLMSLKAREDFLKEWSVSRNIDSYLTASPETKSHLRQ